MMQIQKDTLGGGQMCAEWRRPAGPSHSARETPTVCPRLYKHTASPQLQLQDHHPGDQASLFSRSWYYYEQFSFTFLILMFGDSGIDSDLEICPT